MEALCAQVKNLNNTNLNQSLLDIWLGFQEDIQPHWPAFQSLKAHHSQQQQEHIHRSLKPNKFFFES